MTLLSGIGIGRRHRLMTPRRLGCNQWLIARYGLTLGATPLASGTAPPVVTLSGFLGRALGIRIEITLGGTRGTALFRWSANGGLTWVESGVPTGADVPLGASGIRAAFAAGTYTNDNVYRARAASWLDESGFGNHANQATASKQPLVKSLATANGHVGIAFSAGQVLAHALRLEPPCTVAAVAKTAASAAYATIASYGAGLGGAFLFAAADGANEWGTYANANVLSGASLSTFKRVIAVMRDYDDVDLITNGVLSTVATGVSAYGGPSTIGAGDASGAQTLNGELAELVTIPRALAADDWRRLDDHLVASNAA